MCRLQAEDILRIWETGQALSPVGRAMAILEVAYPEASRDELWSLTVGRRDVRLFRVYARTFKPVLNGVSACPGCNEAVEFDLDTGNVVSAEGPGGDVFDRSADGYCVKYRLPNSLDLSETAAAGDPAEMRRALLGRCIVEAARDGETVPVDRLPNSLITGLAGEMAERDPLAEVLLSLRCPSCGREWRAMVDIVAFLWSDISAEARRLMYDVHVLAGAYGWSEKEILGMGPARRQFYLELIG